MNTFQTLFLSELGAGHDGPPIPPAKRAYFHERLRGRVFDFILGKFLKEQVNGLNKAKLSRRIGKAPEVVNRLLAAPSNLTLDTISDLLIGISAEELDLSSSPLLHRPPVNYSHTDDLAEMIGQFDKPLAASAQDAMFKGYDDKAGEAAKRISGRVDLEVNRKSALCE
jgi:hypothetical protein